MTATRSSSPFDRTADEFRSLVSAICDGAILFVGSGSSCKAGYPTWGELLATLSAAARFIDSVGAATVQGADGLLQASKYRKILGDAAYFRILKETFGTRHPQHAASHEALLRLPFKHVLTTNYDLVLQSAHAAALGTQPQSFDLDEWTVLADFRQSHVDVAKGRRYVHVHGSIRRPEGIVLCKEDYDSRYVHETRARAFLHELLTGQRVVFVGFSLDDEDLKYILREVAGSLALSEPRHFALLTQPDTEDIARVKRANLRCHHLVEPVFFDNSAGNYHNLWKMIDALCEDVAVELGRRGRDARFVAVDALPGILDELLSDKPDARAQLARGLPNLLQRFAVPVSSTSIGTGGTSEVDREIDTIFRLVVKGRYDEAIHDFDQLRTNHTVSLTPKQRYRIAANIGNAHYAKGDVDQAAAAYLRAVEHYRESRDALGIELLGHFLSGDMAKTRQLATVLCGREPHFGRAWALWIRAHDDTTDLATIESAVPAGVLVDAEVAIALSDLARRNGNIEAHERHARAAVAASPDWADAVSTLGGAILTAERGLADYGGDRGLIPHHPDRIAEAERLLSEAIASRPSADTSTRLAGLYFNRSVARRLLAQAPLANEDLRTAFRVDPTEPVIVLGYAMDAESELEFSAALHALEGLPCDGEHDDQVRFAIAWTLFRRGSQADIERAWMMMDQFHPRLDHVQPKHLRGDVVTLALRILGAQGRLPDGVGFVQGLPAAAFEVHQRELFLGRALIGAGQREKARGHAKAAADAIASASLVSWVDRREAALLAQDTGLFAEAVSLWRTVPSASTGGVDSVHLARAAYFAGDLRTALDVCAAARSVKKATRHHLEVEIEVLAGCREADRAITLLQEWIAHNSSDKHALLHLSALALQSGRPELAIFDEDRLPSISEAEHPQIGTTLVYVLRRGPTPERAIEAAYRLYRRFPDHPNAHRALIACVFDPSATPLTIDRPSRVGPNTAVYVRREGEAPRWIYVESEPNPVSSRGELPESHEFVITMLGRNTGGKFQFQDHEYEVVGVEDRILRRVHELMERYEETFPDHPMLRRLHAPANPPDNAPIEVKLGEVYAELKRDDERRLMLESMYRERRLPLASFARMQGKPVFDVVRYLTSDPSMGVRADDGEPGRWEPAVERVKVANEIVIDGTVLAGALMLGLLDDLPALGFKMVVPTSVLDEVRQLSLDAATPRSPRARIGLHQGRLFFHELTLEETAGEVERLERVIRFVNDHCEVAGGEATIDLVADVRKRLTKVLDNTSIDAVALAKKRELSLWTDDLGFQQIVADLKIDGVGFVWTQAVVKASFDAGRLSAARYGGLLGALLAHGYTFTRLSATDAVEILRHASWRIDVGTGAALIRIVCNVALMYPHNRMIVALTIREIWIQCPRRAQAKAIVLAILNGVGRERSKTMLAVFVYRFRPVRQVAEVASSAITAPAGTVKARGRGRHVEVLFDPFKSQQCRSLKRFLRSWRSGDGEFRPGPHERSKRAVRGTQPPPMPISASL